MKRLAATLGLGFGLAFGGACDDGNGAGRGNQGGVADASLCADAITHTKACIENYCTDAGAGDPMCSSVSSEPKADAYAGCGEFEAELAARTLEQNCENLVNAFRSGKNDDSLQTCVGLEDSVELGGASIDLGNLLCAGQGENGFEVCVLGNLFCPIQNDPPEVRCANAGGTCSDGADCSGGTSALDDLSCGDNLACCVDLQCADIDGANCQEGFACGAGWAPAGGSCGDAAVCCVQESCTSAGGYCLPSDKEQSAGCGTGMTRGFGYGGCETGSVCCVPGNTPTPPEEEEEG